MMSDLESKRIYKLFVGALLMEVTIEPNMLLVTKETKTVDKSVSAVYVAEVSFRIGPIISCLYEHAFDIRQGRDGKPLNVFLFPPLVVPYTCFVIENKNYETITERIIRSLDNAGIRYKTVTQGM